VTDADLRGGPRERIAAARPLLRSQDADIAQFEQDRIQEFLRDIVARGDIVDEAVSPGASRARSTSAFNPYFPFFVNISGSPCTSRHYASVITGK
jgi:hypothetical protein